MEDKFEYVPHMGVYMRWKRDGKGTIEVRHPTKLDEVLAGTEPPTFTFVPIDRSDREHSTH